MIAVGWTLAGVEMKARKAWERASREPISERIRAAVDASFSNVSELARDFGVANNTLYRVCNGENLPSVHLLWQLARATGRPMEWFIAGEEAPTEPVLVAWLASRKHPVPPAAQSFLRSLYLGGVTPSPVFYDLALNTLELSVAQGELLKVKAGFVGGKRGYAAPQVPSYPAGRRIPWDVASVQVGSSTGMAAHPEIKSLTATIDNGVEAQHTLSGQQWPARNARTAFRKLSISGTMIFDSLLEYDAFINQSERRLLATFVSKDTIMTNTRNILELSVPSLRYKEFKKPTGGAGRIEVQFTADAVYNSGSGHAFRATLSNTYAAY